MNNFIQFLTVLTIVIFCFSCENNNSEYLSNNYTESTNIKQVETTINAFKDIPLPSEAAKLFELEKTNFNKLLLNSPANVTNYNTLQKKAINLGVYGADLSYANVFDMTQESMLYINCSKKIAEDLGLTNVFDVTIIEQIENNIDKRDSILSIAKNCYIKAEQYFKETENEQLTALILFGGWIEGLYLGTRQPFNAKVNSINEQINQQKNTLIALINLLESFNNNLLTPFINQLNALKEVYFVSNSEEFSKLAAKTEEIRNQFIN